MRAVDPIFARFLNNSLQLCGIMFGGSDDDTYIPETGPFFAVDIDSLRSPAASPPRAGGMVVAETLLPEDSSQSLNPSAVLVNLRARSAAVRRLPMNQDSSAQQVAAQPLPASAAHPARPRCEPMPQALQRLYPFVSRSFTDDHDAFAVIEWSKCTASNLWTILTSSHMYTGAARSMAYMLNFACRSQLNGQLKHFLGVSKLQALQPLITGDRGIKVTSDLERIFLDSCSIPGVLPALCSAMATYNITQNHIIRFKSGVFPEVSSVQQWTARVAAIMVEPSLQSEFHALQNAASDRLALQEPQLRITQHKQRCIERITRDFVNNPDFIPQANPSIQEWCEIDFDSSVVGSDPRSWIWVAQRMQEIKTGMSKLMRNFMKSGEGESDADMVVRDLDFFTRFARRDALWMWIYLCWNRGQDIPAYNVSLLPEDDSFDFGGEAEGDRADDIDSPPRSRSGDSSSSKKKKVRISPPEPDALATAVTRLVRSFISILHPRIYTNAFIRPMHFVHVSLVRHRLLQRYLRSPRQMHRMCSALSNYVSTTSS